MPTKDPCIHCAKRVKEGIHALQSDSCNRWQHRKCNTGITVGQYKQLRLLDNFPWICNECTIVAEDILADEVTIADEVNIAAVDTIFDEDTIQTICFY